MSGAKAVTFIDACCTSASLVNTLQSNFKFSGAIVEVAGSAKTTKTGTVKAGSHGVVATRKTVTVPARNASFDQVKASLAAAREECDVVALSGDNELFLRRLVESESYLFDVLKVNLESISALKPLVVRQLVKQGIIFEIQVAQLLQADIRAKCLTNARHFVRTFARRTRGVVNLIVSSGASSAAGLRSSDELQAIAMLLGLREPDATAAFSSSVQMLLERAATRKRKYFDAKETAAAKQSLSSYKKRPTNSALEDARKRVALWNV